METPGADTGQTTDRVRTALFVLVLAHLALSWIAPPIILAPTFTLPNATPLTVSILRPVLGGLVLSQLVLLAFWLACGSDPLPRRLLSCGALVIAIYFAALVGSQTIGDEFSIARSPAEVTRTGMSFAAGLAILQAPLWFVGQLWTLQTPWKDDGRPMAWKQFPLRFLIGLTASVAVVLSVGRLLIPADTFSGLQPFPIFVGIADWAFFLIGNLIVALPCIRASFADQPTRLLIASSLVFLPAAVLVEHLWLGSLAVAPLDGPLTLLVLNAAECVSIFATLRLLRHVGFRLLCTSFGIKKS